jgi:hypothetical protein
MGFTSGWRINVQIHLINAVAITRHWNWHQGDGEASEVMDGFVLSKVLIGIKEESVEWASTGDVKMNFP